MKIQSAGRLGNILFIWAFALKIAESKKPKKVSIFADKYHSKVDKDLLETFELLDSNLVIFEIKNHLGLVLKVIDKLSSITPSFSRFLQKLLRIQSEGRDELNENAWILRGYFQNPDFSEEMNQSISVALNGILQSKASQRSLEDRFEFLNEPYQAIHIRLSDFIGSDFGVIAPKSQLESLQENLNVVICTDGSIEEIERRIDISDYQVLTPGNTTGWETLAILSRAENLITTNSTLSWWSGFLALQSGKNVWTPAYWNPALMPGKKLTHQHDKQYIPIFE
jgi:hypothetical protein